jgi:hypothetical protein
MDQGEVIRAILGMDAWLDSMRAEHGYTGPVAHRWQDCLIYSGPGFDWRYEGIILGYLRLFETNGDLCWLSKAVRAGDDIASSQLPDGRYSTSSFEANPAPGGTPHEAACDLALLRLAAILKSRGEPGWRRFSSVAEQNLRSYFLSGLWDQQTRTLKNLPHDPSLVPNKAATLAEGLFALAELLPGDDLVTHYIDPLLESILACQVNDPQHPLYGAIDQSFLNGRPGGRYFPFYISRCIPALVAAFQLTARQKYLQAAHSAMGFILRFQQADGSFPQVVYPGGRITRDPQWIAGCGDILRAAHLLQARGFDFPAIERTRHWLLAGRLPSGGLRTARGFARLEGQPGIDSLPDFRDLLPVCGWVDKAFHYLALELPQGWLPAQVEWQDVELACQYRGQRAVYHETRQRIEVLQGLKILYFWQKGEPWASIF